MFTNRIDYIKNAASLIELFRRYSNAPRGFDLTVSEPGSNEIKAVGSELQKRQWHYTNFRKVKIPGRKKMTVASDGSMHEEFRLEGKYIISALADTGSSTV